MNIFSSSPSASSSSSSSSTSKFTLFSTSQNPNPSKFYSFKVPIKTFLLQSSPPPRPLLPPPLSSHNHRNGEIRTAKESLEELLVVRRPVMEASEEDGGGDDELSSSAIIDVGLSEFARKMPIFEPERVELSSGEKPLVVNLDLDLALYRAKVLARSFRYNEAEKLLQKCVNTWPEDGRPYVALGKILSKQSKTAEARAVYEKGCQATQGENAYIWQCWAVLENKIRNVRRARELFDAATVADKRHIAAWHGWAVLELKQGNIKKARNLLGKGLKYCGGNEYIYQTLALLEVKATRYEQARYLFKQATKSNPKSCASWLVTWAQLEMQQENNRTARQLFEKAVQASPKNRFAWHVWGVFEANRGNIDLGRKLLKIGHAVNPRDPVLLQSLALLEYKYSTANYARVLFKRASELDPRHQSVWIAWGWMEWKEGNISTARELYQKALSINSTTESAARCLQAWGVLEQRVGNLSAARRLFRSSLNINSQSYVTGMTWASFEEDQGNSVRTKEIRNLYFQQRTEIVDDASWVMGLLDIIDPAFDSIKRFLNLDRNSYYKVNNTSRDIAGANDTGEESASPSSDYNNAESTESSFDLDAFILERLSLDPSKLDILLERTSQNPVQKKTRSLRKVWRLEDRTTTTLPKL
ncbi:LOW QUALITY PROTEIN: protein high chlorophyll fluorescent 107-like [Camellia sinensis]|uniref:LOW QUALITY PROTEIN: protein high chlorophyll fluorescent 107-like n=1 Tax=Camellia sinensis TaxID=4442 RepID=UPI001036CA95|nr:LOW QUALITY PROTEIN: protein high chlorophyll fluorescent 107-like [Camellia sinensis]